MDDGVDCGGQIFCQGGGYLSGRKYPGQNRKCWKKYGDCLCIYPGVLRGSSAAARKTEISAGSDSDKCFAVFRLLSELKCSQCSNNRAGAAELSDRDDDRFLFGMYMSCQYGTADNIRQDVRCVPGMGVPDRDVDFLRPADNLDICREAFAQVPE